MSRNSWIINGADFSMKRTSVDEEGQIKETDFNKENAQEYINSLEKIADAMFRLIDDFESSMALVLGLDKEKSTLEDIERVVNNIMNGADMYEGLSDKSKIIDDKSANFKSN